jgi:hypothetical protein
LGWLDCLARLATQRGGVCLYLFSCNDRVQDYLFGNDDKLPNYYILPTVSGILRLVGCLILLCCEMAGWFTRFRARLANALVAQAWLVGLLDICLALFYWWFTFCKTGNCLLLFVGWFNGLARVETTQREW